MKGEYASDVEFLEWHPGHTRHAVAIDLGEGLDTQNGRGWQTLAGCKSSVGGINACTHSKEPSWKVLLNFTVRKIGIRMYLQMHILGMMFHGGPI